MNLEEHKNHFSNVIKEVLSIISKYNYDISRYQIKHLKDKDVIITKFWKVGFVLTIIYDYNENFYALNVSNMINDMFEGYIDPNEDDYIEFVVSFLKEMGSLEEMIEDSYIDDRIPYDYDTVNDILLDNNVVKSLR